MKHPRDALATTYPRLPFWLTALTLLASCGGGSPDTSASLAANPQSEGVCSTTGAIEGGGMQKLSGTVSDVSAQGELTVSDIHVSTAGADIVVDGVSARVAGIRRGDVVIVTGKIDTGARTGCAVRVFADADITAAIDEVDPAAGTLTVLGQVVRVDANTVFGDGITPPQLSGVRAGDRIRVSGLRAIGSITATRIDAAAREGGYFVTGVVTGLDTARRAFRINQIAVQYDEALLSGFPAGEPENGDSVRLIGTAFDMAQSSPPGSTILRPEQLDYIDYGTPLTILPEVVAVATGSTIQFITSGGTGGVTWRVFKSDGSTCRPEDCGAIDASGRYTAPYVERSFLVTAASVTNPADRVTASVVVISAPVAVIGPHTITGEVFAVATGMVANAYVDMWIQHGSFGYSYWWGRGPLKSDAIGHFEAQGLPDAKVSVYASKDGFVQPCAVTQDLQRDVAVRVELIPKFALDALDPPRPQLAVEPWITGVISEVTPNGRQPVSGAMVWLEETMGIVYATTLSDRGGGFFVCNVGNLPTQAWLTVGAPGFASQSIGPVNSAESMTIDVVLQRL